MLSRSWTSWRWLDLQWTGHPVLRAVMDRARGWEEREPGACVNVFLGFPWADVATVGTSVHVMTNDDQELADRIADDMAGYLWSTRAEWSKGGLPSSRVHFRKGFDDTGYAKKVIVVDAPGDWFGTVRLDALDYRNVDVRDFYPFGDPSYHP